MVEALAVSPALVAFITLFLSFLFVAGAVSLLQDRLDETLVCLTYRPRSECEHRMSGFIQKSGLSILKVRTHFLRNGTLWTGRVTLHSPWGQEQTFSRSIDSRFSKNFR
ncbi:MAG: hypothetical protein KF789_10150 [Bdellovibrionaceae bacterium]|nr:hypothetical protein [Pseudobdellovibrionaceae bacterium]